MLQMVSKKILRTSKLNTILELRILKIFRNTLQLYYVSVLDQLIFQYEIWYSCNVLVSINMIDLCTGHRRLKKHLFLTENFHMVIFSNLQNNIKKIWFYKAWLKRIVNHYSDWRRCVFYRVTNFTWGTLEWRYD